MLGASGIFCRFLFRDECDGLRLRGFGFDQPGSHFGRDPIAEGHDDRGGDSGVFTFPRDANAIVGIDRRRGADETRATPYQVSADVTVGVAGRDL